MFGSFSGLSLSEYFANESDDGLGLDAGSAAYLCAPTRLEVT